MFAGNFDLRPSISFQFTIQQPKIAKNSLKPSYFGVEGHSRLLMFIALKSTLPVLVMISSTSVPICNRFQTRQANSAKNHYFLKGYPSSTPTCAGLVERRRLKPRPPKSTFNTENFTCRLSWSVSRSFGAIHS